MLKKYRITAEYLREHSRKDAEEMEARRGERERLNGTELDALIRINVASCLLETAEEDLRGLAKRTDVKMLKATSASLAKACRRLITGVPLPQLRTLEANTRNSYVICTADRVPYYTNVRHEYLSAIVKQASKQCDYECTKTREQSKQCPLRRAFDSIPGMKEATRINANDAEHCPYTMCELPDITE